MNFQLEIGPSFFTLVLCVQLNYSIVLQTDLECNGETY